MAKPHVALDVEIPSDVRYIEGVVELATRKCRELSIEPRKCTLNVRVALSEAISNAILRGNGDAADKHVRVRATIHDDSLVFDVVDEGPGFDLGAERPDPTSLENLLNEDGRGLFLMEKLMDRVERFQSDGNVVRLTLRRS
ncbi:MAG TPA: ATP-binding protein [Gemmatimonadaceae bacterium]|nr:ATP-binding protein [Gemmatimonadaceae bacterium]